MANSNEYMRAYLNKRYKDRKQETIDFLGGECVVCGKTNNLEIDHKNREDKLLEISKQWSANRVTYFEELKKCQLLCRDHHKEKTINEKSVPHGGGKTGKRNCYCDLCKPLKRKYLKEKRYERLR